MGSRKFLHFEVTRTHVLESVCRDCGCTVAFSKKLYTLELAERVHRCRDGERAVKLAPSR
jgi:hypothetical protein